MACSAPSATAGGVATKLIHRKCLSNGDLPSIDLRSTKLAVAARLTVCSTARHPRGLRPKYRRGETSVEWKGRGYRVLRAVVCNKESQLCRSCVLALSRAALNPKNKKIVDAIHEVLLKTLAAGPFCKAASAMKGRRRALSRTMYSRNFERLL